MLYQPGDKVYNHLLKKFGQVRGGVPLGSSLDTAEYYLVSTKEDIYEIWNSYHLHGLSNWFLVYPNYPNSFGEYCPFEPPEYIREVKDTKIWVNEHLHLLILKPNFDITKVQFINILDLKPCGSPGEAGKAAQVYRILLDSGNYKEGQGNPKI